MALAVMLQRRPNKKKQPSATKYATKGADKFVAEGRYEEAGRLAMISNNWEEAIDLYRFAGKPDLAAAAARRAGQLIVAAELYDQAGDAESAAICRNAHTTLSSFPPSAPLPDPTQQPMEFPAAPNLPVVPDPPHAALPPPPAPPAIPSAPNLPQLDLQLPAPPPATPIPDVASIPDPQITESKPPRQKLQAGSVPPHPSFGSKPPGKSSYSFISEPPKKKSSAPPPKKAPAPRKKKPRSFRSTKPLGTSDEKPLISKAETDALISACEAAGGVAPRELKAFAEARAVHDLQAHRERWYSRTQIAEGLESHPVDISLLSDAAVSAAATGSDIASLLPFVRDMECDLGNIEVYYRIGLAYASCGQWEAALGAFQAVDGVSPGYRGADARAEAITAWRDALGDKRSGLGTGAAYDIVGEIGRGAHAVVYRASPWDSDDDLALKVLTGGQQDDKTLAALVREAEAASSLNHPDIVRIYDHGIADGRAWLSMDLVDGVVVDAVYPALTIVEKLHVLVTLLDALAFAHDANVVHGDVRPANLIMRPNGRIALCEFGVTRAVGGAAPSFMAPEQLRGASEDHRTDIFGVGVTAYALLSGRLPFDGRERDGKVKPLMDVPGMPEAIDEAVRKALAVDPVRRWPSAKAFKRPLKAVLDAIKG